MTTDFSIPDYHSCLHMALIVLMIIIRLILVVSVGADCGAKWRAGLKIGPTEPSQLTIEENVQGLARYVIICQ